MRVTIHTGSAHGVFKEVTVSDPSEAVDLFNLLISASRKALATAHFEAAYHALAAALHCAQDMKDANRLDEVAKEARLQLQHVNTIASTNTMSSFAAAERPSGVDLYDTLAHTASARAQMVRHDEDRGVKPI